MAIKARTMFGGAVVALGLLAFVSPAYAAFCDKAAFTAHPKWFRAGGYCDVASDPTGNPLFLYGSPHESTGGGGYVDVMVNTPSGPQLVRFFDNGRSQNWFYDNGVWIENYQGNQYHWQETSPGSKVYHFEYATRL